MNLHQNQPETEFTARLRYFNIEYDVRFILNTRNNYNIIFQDYELKKHRKNVNTSVNYRCRQGFKCPASLTIYKNQIIHLVNNHSPMCLKYNQIGDSFNSFANKNQNPSSNHCSFNQLHHPFNNVNVNDNELKNYNNLIINPYQCRHGYDCSVFQSNHFNNMSFMPQNYSLNSKLNFTKCIINSNRNDNNNFPCSSNLDGFYF
jgi:hypothetical protein